MAEPVLPPPPGPVPAEDPVAVEAVVPPAEPAEPVEGVEVIALVFYGFCVCSSRSFPALRFLGRLVLYLLALVCFSASRCSFFSSLLGRVPLHLRSSPSHVGFAVCLCFLVRLVLSLRIFCVVVLQFALLNFLLPRVRGARF